MKVRETQQALQEIGDMGHPGSWQGKILNAIARSSLDPPHHIHNVMRDALH